jgi:hypothetical protein
LYARTNAFDVGTKHQTRVDPNPNSKGGMGMDHKQQQNAHAPIEIDDFIQS